MTKEGSMGASADADRAVVNGASKAVSALRASIPSAGRFIAGYFAHLWRVAAPFFLCLLGGVFTGFGVEAGGTARIIAFVIAGILYAWAVDFARMRAAAERDKDWGARTLAMVMEDHYAEITVTNKQTFYADEATRAALAAGKARDEEAA